MKDNQVQQDLALIRNLMERSSRFISLSGFSGILAGVYALVGSAIAFYMLNNTTAESGAGLVGKVTAVAFVVLAASVSTALVLSARKAKKTGQQMWGPTSRLLLFHMMVPLLTGGIFIAVLLYQGNVGVLGAVSLIFYGLALLGASNYTFTDIKYLGLCEIVIGLIAAIYPAAGLLLWATGFGVLHIVYGSVMYFKYDR
jgi:hypothetical protein